MKQEIIAVLSLVTTTFSSYSTVISPVAEKVVVEKKQEEVLASQQLDLTNRYDSQFVNQVFKDNIVLALVYLKGEKSEKEEFEVSFVLQPGEAFAFHENILTEFKDEVIKTTESKFIASEGYRSSGFIVGDGVCHLASLINWVATEAGLEVTAKVNHDFRPIPGIPRQYGTSIRYSQSGHNSQNQNLYIKNNFSFSVEFKFTVRKEKVELTIVKKND